MYKYHSLYHSLIIDHHGVFRTAIILNLYNPITIDIGYLYNVKTSIRQSELNITNKKKPTMVNQIYRESNMIGLSIVVYIKVLYGVQW